MNWKEDQNERKQYDDISDDDYLDDNFSVVDEENIILDESIEPESKNDESSGQRNIILITIGIAIVSSIFVNFLFRSKNSDLANLERRIKKMEETTDKFDSVNEKMDRIWEQAKNYEKLEDKIDRTEASLTLRMDHLAMSQDTIQNRMNKMQSAKQEDIEPQRIQATGGTDEPPVISPSIPSATIKPSQPSKENTVAADGDNGSRYHIVKVGETLYRISMMYNLSIEELARMNQLPKNPVIKVGEKLIVSVPQ